MTRSLLTTAVLAATLAVAGCQSSTGSSTGTTSTTAGTGTATVTSSAVAGGDTVAWADKACGEILRMNDALAGATPPSLTNPDTQQLLTALNQFIANYVGTIDEAIARIKAIGPPPVEGDQQALTASLDELKKILETAKTRLAAVDVNNQQAAQLAIIEAFAGVAQMTSQQYSPHLTSASQQLADAFQKAPNCQKFEPTTSGTGSATRSTTTTTS